MMHTAQPYKDLLAQRKNMGKTSVNFAFRIFSGIGTLIMILSLNMPWLVISFLGQFSISIADLYRLVLELLRGSIGHYPAPVALVVQLALTVGPIIITIILYPVSVILGLVSVAIRDATLPAAASGIISGISWFFGAESLKSIMVREAIRIGGPLGQVIAGALTSIVTVRYGPYIVVLGGIVVAIGYFLPSPLRLLEHDASKFVTEDSTTSY